MKIRDGFVSNSSSSSFIVGFEKVPESIEEMKNLLFGDKKQYKIYDWQGYADTRQMAQVVFQDLLKSTPLNEKEIVTLLEEIKMNDLEESTIKVNIKKWPSAIPWNDEEGSEERNKKWDIYISEIAELAKAIYDDSIKLLESRLTFYGFSYSDDSELGSIMEHGRIFRNIPHIIIGQH